MHENKRLVHVTIDGIGIDVPQGTTIYEAAKKVGVHIPILCHHPDIKEKLGACRICLVEVEGFRNMVPSCSTEVTDGMKVKTNTRKVREARKFVLELLKSIHKSDCLNCVKSSSCEFLKLTNENGLHYEGKLPLREAGREKDTSSVSVIRDSDKCIYCGRCETVCSMMQNVYALSICYRSSELYIGPAMEVALADTPCVGCGQCIVSCPVGAIFEKDDTQRVWDAIDDPEKVVVVQTAPAIRVALGEEFGLEPGTIVTHQMVKALRVMGFDYVFDTQFGADLTICEEASELVERIKKGERLPILTSCCPAWVKYLETYHPELLKNLSSAKSPQAMLGAIVKSYFAEKIGKDPKDIVVVSVMPCTAKKFEAVREELRGTGYPDVDIVITTRELARMMKQAGIDLPRMPRSTFDNPLGVSTGAAAIFGTTGGVMEAALRSTYEFLTGQELKEVVFEEVRGLEGIKQLEVEVEGKKVKIIVAHTLANAEKALQAIESGELKDVVAMEVMACPGGCIAGGGQPIPVSPEIRRKRMEAIYLEDEVSSLKKSHENPYIKFLYEDYLGKPLSEKSEKLLHTSYCKRDKYKKVED